LTRNVLLIQRCRPDPLWDIVGGNIVVEVEPNKDEFKVVYNWSRTDIYPLWGSTTTAAGGQAEPEGAYAWSKKSDVYHYEGCKYVSNISPANLERGSSPPQGKRLHENCPMR
jgi:hypothetical protein